MAFELLAPQRNPKTGKVENYFEKFEDKAAVKLTIERWLELADIDSLDDENAYARIGRTPFDDTKVLSFRTTGLKIKLTFYYMSEDGINAGKMEKAGWWDSVTGHRVTCFVYADVIKSYQSFGSSVHYTDQGNMTLAPRVMDQDYPTYATNGYNVKTTFRDRYNRGIKFEFAVVRFHDKFRSIKL